MRDFANPFRVVHGTLRDARASAFAIVKDEMFYLPSFLDHHRRLGVDQFVILDDQSSDGTRELLAAQPDCLVLESPFRFGEEVAVPGSDGRRRERAGILFKSLIPQRFLPLSQYRLDRPFNRDIHGSASSGPTVSPVRLSIAPAPTGAVRAGSFTPPAAADGRQR